LIHRTEKAALVFAAYVMHVHFISLQIKPFICFFIFCVYELVRAVYQLRKRWYELYEPA